MGQIFNIPEEHIDNVLGKYETHLSQLQVCEEECSELIKAISKHIRTLQHTSNVSKEEARAAIVEETAHVAISLGMLSVIFEISQKEIEDEVRKKVAESGFDDSSYSYSESKEPWHVSVGDMVSIEDNRILQYVEIKAYGCSAKCREKICYKSTHTQFGLNCEKTVKILSEDHIVYTFDFCRPGCWLCTKVEKI